MRVAYRVTKNGKSTILREQDYKANASMYDTFNYSVECVKSLPHSEKFQVYNYGKGQISDITNPIMQKQLRLQKNVKQGSSYAIQFAGKVFTFKAVKVTPLYVLWEQQGSAVAVK